MATSLGMTRKYLLPTKHPTTLDIAWAAGIYEGEGTCDLGSTAHTCISQKDREILDRLRALFGGKITAKISKTPGGRVTDEPIYLWQMSGALARGFLMTIYTFLSARRKTQVRSALGR